MIEVKNLVKRYGPHTAVEDLSFTIEKGKVYGFLGPNGAGKSTTMNIMTGYLSATEGEVIINGCNILSDPEKAKAHIGYLPEQPPLYADMTVLEYLKFVCALKHVDKANCQEQLTVILDMVKLEDVQNRLIRNLSKGYKQRVGLAQALIGFPEIIILDEPTVGLDPQQIIEIRQLIRNLAKEHTVLLSSHILSEVQEVCDHIMIIYKGRLVASDTPENLEKGLRSSKTISLLAKGEPVAVEKVFKGLPGIASYSCQAAEDGCTLAELSITSEQNETDETSRDIREELFWRFAKHQLPLLMISSSQSSLEDVFLELTSDSVLNNGSAPDNAPAAGNASMNSSGSIGSSPFLNTNDSMVNIASTSVSGSIGNKSSMNTGNANSTHSDDKKEDITDAGNL